MTEAPSRTARPGGAKPAATDDGMEAQLHAIRTEVAAMADMMGTLIKDKAHLFGATAGAAAEQASAQARRARESLEHGMGQAEKVLDDRVQAHPLQSILMAFGLGMLISLLFRR